jgi:hypothetical protein
MPRWGQVASNSVQTLWASELNNGRECQTKACLWVSIGHSVGSNYGYGSGIIFSKRACACLKMGGISPQRASLMGEKVDNPLGFWSSPLNSQGTQIPMVNGSALSWTLWTIPGASGACGSCGCPESRGLKGGWSQVARYSKPNHAVPKKMAWHWWPNAASEVNLSQPKKKTVDSWPLEAGAQKDSLCLQKLPSQVEGVLLRGPQGPFPLARSLAILCQ